LPGVPNRANQAIVPEGSHIGLGVKTSAIRNVHLQGNLVNTGNKLDIALAGQGWFEIEGANGEQFYTRAGSFNTNAEGQLVTVDGYLVTGGIVIPDNAIEVIVNKSGQFFARYADQVELEELGQLTLSNFSN